MEYLNAKVIRDILRDQQLAISTEVNVCQSPFSTYPLRADFFVASLNTFIEFDGPQHFMSGVYGELEKTVMKDLTKSLAIFNAGQKLLRVTGEFTTVGMNEMLRMLSSDEKLRGIYCKPDLTHTLIYSENDIKEFYQSIVDVDIMAQLGEADKMKRLEAENKKLMRDIEFLSESLYDISGRTKSMKRSQLQSKPVSSYADETSKVRETSAIEFAKYLLTHDALGKDNHIIPVRIIHIAYIHWYHLVEFSQVEPLTNRAFHVRFEKVMHELGYLDSEKNDRKSTLQLEKEGHFDRHDLLDCFPNQVAVNKDIVELEKVRYRYYYLHSPEKFERTSRLYRNEVEELEEELDIRLIVNGRDVEKFDRYVKRIEWLDTHDEIRRIEQIAYSHLDRKLIKLTLYSDLTSKSMERILNHLKSTYF